MSLYFVALCPTFSRENREICSMVVEQSLLSQVDVPLSAWASLEEMGFLQDDLPILFRLRPYMVSRFLSFYSCLSFFCFFSFRLSPLARDLCRGQMRKQTYYIFTF